MRRRRVVAVVAALQCCRIRFPFWWLGSKQRVRVGAELRLLHSLAIAFLLSQALFAQTASLRGQVIDESGALVPRAKVTINGPSGSVKTTEADRSDERRAGGE